MSDLVVGLTSICGYSSMVLRVLISPSKQILPLHTLPILRTILLWIFPPYLFLKMSIPFIGAFPVAQQWRIHLQCRSRRRCGFDPWVGKISWRTAWLKNTHFSILAWRIPRAEEPGRQQSIVSQRVRHNWNDLACTHPPHRLRLRKRPGNSAPYPGLNRNTYYLYPI